MYSYKIEETTIESLDVYYLLHIESIRFNRKYDLECGGREHLLYTGCLIFKCTSLNADYEKMKKDNLVLKTVLESLNFRILL